MTLSGTQRLWIKSCGLGLGFAVIVAAGFLLVPDRIPELLTRLVSVLAEWQLVVAEALGLETRLGLPAADASRPGPPTMAVASLIWAWPFASVTIFPAVRRLWPERPDIVVPVGLRTDVDPEAPDFAGRPALVGREDALQALMRFAGRGGGEGPAWAQLSGPHGIGKTRLAYEWLARLEAGGWDAGLLAPGTDALAVSRALFRARTAIVVDEAGRDPAFWDNLAGLLAPASYIRILVIDQVPLEVPPNLPKPARDSIEARRFGLDPLGRMGEATMRSIAPEATERMLQDADGRPLYVLLGDDPVATIARRVADRNGIAASDAERRYLAFAALAAPVTVDVLSARLGTEVPTTTRRAILQGGADRKSLKEGLPRLVPEPFANGFLLGWIADQDDATRDALFEAAIAANPGAVEARLRALWTGLTLGAQHREGCRALQTIFDTRCPDRVEEARRRFRAAFDLTAEAPARGPVADWSALAPALTALDELARARPHDAWYQERFCRVVVDAIARYGEARDFRALERWGGRLAAVTQEPAWAGHAEIRLREANAAVTAIYHYGNARDFAALERWGARLAAVTQDPAWAGHTEIRLRETMGAVNAIGDYGKARDFAALERWAARLAAVTQDPAWAGHAEIRLREATGAVNAINHYGEARDFAALERWGARLAAVTQDPAWAGHAEIRLREAMGAVNAISHYGKARDSGALERWAARLATVTQDPAWAGHAEIRLEEAKGAVNAIGHYGLARDFAALERWGTRLTAVTQDPAWAGHAEIRLEEANGAVNAIGHYGQARDFAALERWGARLAAVTQDPAWAGHTEIRLRETMGAVNAIREYGEARDFAALERWGARLAAVTQDPAWAGHAEIRLREAKGAVNAAIDYAASGAGDDLDRWRARLAAVAWDIPGHGEIQSLAHRYGVSYVEQARRREP